uniref:Uncharacterized protein n=1 Tax=Ascaris lumbricoides TaxID=6252 RepID=A0A0M3HYK0_ASCLU
MNNGAQIAACKLSEVRAKPSTTSLSRPLSDSSMRDSRRESIQKRAIDGEWSVRVGRCAEVGTKLEPQKPSKLEQASEYSSLRIRETLEVEAKSRDVVVLSPIPSSLARN